MVMAVLGPVVFQPQDCAREFQGSGMHQGTSRFSIAIWRQQEILESINRKISLHISLSEWMTQGSAWGSPLGTLHMPSPLCYQPDKREGSAIHWRSPEEIHSRKVTAKRHAPPVHCVQHTHVTEAILVVLSCLPYYLTVAMHYAHKASYMFA